MIDPLGLVETQTSPGLIGVCCMAEEDVSEKIRHVISGAIWSLTQWHQEEAEWTELIKLSVIIIQRLQEC